jgi:hypothetical protein
MRGVRTALNQVLERVGAHAQFSRDPLQFLVIKTAEIVASAPPVPNPRQ